MMRKFTLFSLFFLCCLPWWVTAQTNPTREWGTYYGGMTAYVTNTATDKSGNVYMAGWTKDGGKYKLFGELFITPGIASPGSFQDTLYQTDTASNFNNIKMDAFLVKFNSAGVRQWATYYGGEEEERPIALACDGDGNVYMAGWTASTNAIATSGSYQSLYAGGNSNTYTNPNSDGFLVKFDSSGQRQWGTYYGGTDNEVINSIAFDQDNNVFIGGATESANAISSPGSFQPTFAGGAINSLGGTVTDAFVAKFSSTGARQWATYYGDTLTDVFTSVVCDAAGNVYAAGETASLANIATSGSHQDTAGGGGQAAFPPYYPYSPYNDCFLVKFNTEGQRQWATYYGGNQIEGAIVVSYDKANNNIYLAGITSSASNIATPGSFQEQNFTTGEYEFDAFLARFDTAGVRQWGTYYGGAAGINSGYKTGLGCDRAGNIFLSQTAQGIVNIATPGSYQDTLSSAPDIFLVKFSNNGNRIWGTYYGGTGALYGNNDYSTGGLALDDQGGIYVSGVTSSPNSIATAGSFQDTAGYSFLVKFYDCIPDASIANIGNGNTFCAGDTLLLKANNTSAQSYQWQKDGTDITNATDTVLTVTTSGIYRLIASNGMGCSDTSAADTIIMHPLPAVSITVDEHTLYTGSFVTYQWNWNGQAIQGATDSAYTATQNGDYTVTITDTNGCTATAAIQSISDITGIDNVALGKAIHIYPNPAHDILYINAPVPVRVTVYSMEGRLLLLENNAKQVRVKSLTTGMYLLKVSDNKGNLIKTSQFVKAE